jgi:hypothetical protein
MSTLTYCFWCNALSLCHAQPVAPGFPAARLLATQRFYAPSGPFKPRILVCDACYGTRYRYNYNPADDMAPKFRPGPA